MRNVARAALAVVLLLQWGCSAGNRGSWIQQPGWSKPWTYRSGVAAAVCAAIGAGAGVGVQSARTNCDARNSVPPNSQIISEDCQTLGDSGDSTFWLWGALIGAAAGALLCGVLGHVFLDPAPPEHYVPPPPPPAMPQPAPAQGVPLHAPVKQRIVLRGVNFEYNSSDIQPEAAPVLDQAAEILNQNPGVTVRIEGYTDSSGTPQYNQALSLRRAESVDRYLVNRGVDPERFTVEGMGQSRPVASNATETGRAQNRRVELVPNQ